MLNNLDQHSTDKRDNSDSLFNKAVSPILHAALTFAVALFVMLVGKLCHKFNILGVDELFPWMSASAFLLLFSISNSIFSLSAMDLNKYWLLSFAGFIGLASASAGAAYLISSIWIDEAGSYQWIFFVITFGYLVFLSLMGFVKRIVEFAQKEEWNRTPNRKN